MGGALASAIVFRTRSGRTKGSCRVATHAGPISRAVDAISLGGKLRAEGWAIRGPGHPCSL